MDFGFKEKLSVILVVIHGTLVSLAHIVSSREDYTKQLDSRRRTISLF